MRKFTDASGTEWSVTVDCASLKRVKGLTGFDLGTDLQEKMGRLAGDTLLLCDVLYALCKPEADARGVSDEDFGRALRGDAIEKAAAVLVGEIVDFCPSPSLRALLGQMVWAQEQVQRRAEAMLTARLEAMPAVLDRAMADADARAQAEIDRLLSTSGAPSGSAPGSSASTPGPSPSGS